MKTIQAHTATLAGTNHEIGRRLGKMTAEIAPLKDLHIGEMEGFGKQQAAEAAALFRRWCPGLVEELEGFAEALHAAPEQVFFYGMTYLLPRCSQIAALPGATAGEGPLLARSYEFSHEAEDFCLVKTAVRGRYAHLGTSTVQFGRDDGVNEHGLAVSMSSCGFPVGAMPFMRAPRLKGLQFWAVIRALLENCKDVPEALRYMEGMPIAYNLNLMLMDKAGRAALVETLDGRMAVKQIDGDTPEQVLWATNHAVLPELAAREPQAMVHSVQRYRWIAEQLGGAAGLTRQRLKEMLLAPYPNGLCCHYYEEYFGTTKSMVIAPAEGTVELCWGGRAENGWKSYDVHAILEEGTQSIALELERADPAVYAFQPL